jgi:hypothetical protein
MQKSTTESASWQKPLYGIKINQNLPEIPLKSGVLGRPGVGAIKVLAKRGNDTSGKLSFLVRYEGYQTIDIGIFDIISNGLHFEGRIDGKDISINLLT